MADKSFGIKELNLIGASGTPTITSPNNLNLNAGTVAISTDVTVGRHLDVDGHAELDNLNVSGVSTFSDTVNVGAGKSIRLYGASSGYSDIIAAAGSASTTFTLPANGGSSGQYLQTNGSGALSWATVATGAQWTESSASLTGASQEWTGIPSTARQIIITHQGWSNASSSQHWCQIGDSGGFEDTGYYTGNVYFGAASGGTDYDNQSAFIQGQATDPSTAVTGTIILSRLNNSNQWTILWHYSPSNGYLYAAVGNKALSDTLDRVRILPSTGNFDAGIANLMYLS